MSIVLDDTVDREMGVNGAHFIRETLVNRLNFSDHSRPDEPNSIYLRDASNHICDQALDGPQTRNVFASTLPDSESNLVGRLALD
jgi:hypothetical protein